MKILLIAPYGIGNTILALPAMKALRKKFPGQRIDLLATLGSVYRLVKEIPDFRLFNSVYRLGLKDLLKIMRSRYDWSILLFPSVKIHYNILNFLTLAKKRIGALYPGSNFKRAPFLNTLNVPVRVGIHDAEQNMRLLAPLGVSCPTVREITSRLASGKKKSVIGIHPGCKKKDYYRRWANANYAEVIRLILSRSRWGIKLFFGPDEKEDLLFFQKHFGSEKRIRFVVNRRMKELFREIGGCRLFLSNDSGLMHIASFLRVFSVSLWGSSDFRRTGPFNDPKKIIFPDIPCRPCAHTYEIKSYGFRCVTNDIRCMKMITVGKVWKVLEKFF